VTKYLSPKNYLLPPISPEFSRAPTLGGLLGLIKRVGIQSKKFLWSVTTSECISTHRHEPGSLLRPLPPSIELYQTVLLDTGSICDETHQELVNHTFVKSRLIPGSRTKSLLHTVRGGYPQLINPCEPIQEQELPSKVYQHGLSYIRQVFEYREHLLKAYVESERGGFTKQYYKDMSRLNHHLISYLAEELAAVSRLM
jgi:hypothetical protein